MDSHTTDGLGTLIVIVAGFSFALGWFICKAHMLAKLAKWEQDKDEETEREDLEDHCISEHDCDMARLPNKLSKEERQ